jgi:hypothetical protein
MSVVIVITAVIVIVAVAVLLSMRASRRRATSHHIGLPELGSFVKGGGPNRRWRSAHECRAAYGGRGVEVLA